MRAELVGPSLGLRSARLGPGARGRLVLERGCGGDEGHGCVSRGVMVLKRGVVVCYRSSSHYVPSQSYNQTDFCAQTNRT